MENQEFLFWNPPLAAVQSQVDARPDGLTGEEARARSQHFGPNSLRVHHERALIGVRGAMEQGTHLRQKTNAGKALRMERRYGSTNSASPKAGEL